MVNKIPQEEKDLLLSKAMRDLQFMDPKTIQKSGFFMLTGFEDNVLYEVTFKGKSLLDGKFGWEIDTVKVWEG